MNRHARRSIVLAVARALLLVVAPVAFADNPTCIPIAQGVPGNATPPDWVDASQPAVFRALDDPRWVGAARISFNDGAGYLADFRALHANDGGGEKLYLSWRVFFASPPPAPTAQAALSHVYVGIPRTAGDVIIDVTPANDSPGSGEVGTLAIHRQLADGTLDAPDVPIPEVLATSRVWFHQPTSSTFAVEMRIPMSEIDASGGTFPMWFGMTTNVSSSVAQVHWPTDASGAMSNLFGGGSRFPLRSAWKSFHVRSGADATPCAADVSLDVSHIGADHPAGPPSATDSEIVYQLPAASNTLVNRLFARATNNGTATIAAGTLRARFRTANWGSVIGVGATWDDVPGAGDVGSSGDLPPGTTATAAAGNDIHFDWVLTPAEIAPFENGTRNRDNCMLVTLSSTTGLTFLNDSVRRNMMFRQASTMTQQAEISVKGAPPFAADGRDVYLVIETLNMPAHVQPSPETPGVAMKATTTPGGSAQQLEQAAANGQISEEQMDQSVPTYRIHVFHDTGERWSLNGVEHPVVEPQGGFGYRVVHQGDLAGWAHKTVCVDCTMTKVAPNVYRISHVPNDGVVHVRTTIEAREHGGSASRYRWFLDLGPNVTHGSFADFVDGRWSINAGIERTLGGANSIELIAGYHRFSVERLTNPHIWQLSLGGKHFFGTTALQPFVNGAVGAYRFEPGGTTKAGASAGAGVLWNVTSVWGVEAAANYHWVNTSGSSAQFSTWQLGIRRSF